MIFLVIRYSVNPPGKKIFFWVFGGGGIGVEEVCYFSYTPWSFMPIFSVFRALSGRLLKNFIFIFALLRRFNFIYILVYLLIVFGSNNALCASKSDMFVKLFYLCKQFVYGCLLPFEVFRFGRLSHSLNASVVSKDCSALLS